MGFFLRRRYVHQLVIFPTFKDFERHHLEKVGQHKRKNVVKGRRAVRKQRLNDIGKDGLPVPQLDVVGVFENSLDGGRDDARCVIAFKS